MPIIFDDLFLCAILYIKASSYVAVKGTDKTENFSVLTFTALLSGFDLYNGFHNFFNRKEL